MQRNFLTLAGISLIISACTDPGTIGSEGAAGAPLPTAGRTGTVTSQAGAPTSGGTSALNASGSTNAVNTAAGASMVAPIGGSAGASTTFAIGGEATTATQNGGKAGGTAIVRAGAAGMGQAGGTAIVRAGAAGMGQAGGTAIARAGAAGMGQSGGAAGASPVGGSSSTMAGRTGTAGQSGALANADQVLTSCGIKKAEPFTLTDQAIPTDLTTATPQALWGALRDTCQAGGWDLTQCQGFNATWAVAETIPSATVINPPQKVAYVASGDKLCCVYLTDNAPGAGYPAQCGPAIAALAQKTLNDCKIPNDGNPKVQQIEIPAELTGPNWGVKKDACRDGGWDLSQCAGGNATFTALGTSRESEPGHPFTAWVVTRNNQVCCVYESDDSTPGIYSATCAK